MIGILISAAAGFVVAILLTPYLIKVFARQGFGQEIRDELADTHGAKRGTPTMGGVAILVALWVGYLCAHLYGALSEPGSEGPTASGLLVLMLASVLGVVGFLDDFLKVRKARNLGLNKTAKSVGLLLGAVIFGVLVMQFAGADGLTPASEHLSFIRDIPAISFGAIGFVVFAIVVITAWSNAVNFTDGLDGLASGSSAMVFATYVVIAFFQNGHDCTQRAFAGCFYVRDPLDLALVAAAGLGACAGFLWWNGAPAKIIMGDTGALALGGMVAGLSIATRTELLMVIVGGLFVMEILSDVLQIVVFRTSGRRLFKMAPFHHHFELLGWAETSIIIRFWLLAGICCMLGLGVFYSGWITAGGM